MRIADVAEFYAEQGGGVRTYLEAKLRAGAAMGVDVSIVAPGPRQGEEPRCGGRIIWVRGRPVPGDPRYFLLTRASSVHRALDRVRPDVVEGSSPYGGAWFAASWPQALVRSLVFHQDPVAALAHPLFDRVFSRDRIDRAAWPVWRYLSRLSARYDATVVAGRWLERRLARFGVPRVTAVPFGIEPEPFWAARRDDALRVRWLDRLGLPESGHLLVAVSRHHPEKRLPVLIEAVRRVDEPVGLVIFGDGPSRGRIERLARLGSRVILAGYTRDRAALAQVLASADAFLHGSGAETFGLVVSEATAAGLPVVVPSSGGAAELVASPQGEARSGARFETYAVGDVEGCAAAIRRLVHRDPGMLRAAAAAAAVSVRTLDEHFKELFGFYAGLLERKNQRGELL